MHGLLQFGASRQDQVLKLLMDGKSEKEIAACLGLSPHTVHVYVKALYREHAVGSRPELMAKFFHAAIALISATRDLADTVGHPRAAG
jgi:DNA-binding CsgD family transcriptional regulator